MSLETVALQKLSIGYKTKRGTRMVADGMNATIRSGELTCLLGENGVGKSTLLRTLSGFQPMLGGNVAIEGRPLKAMTQREIARTVSVVLTERLDVQHMTVSELVALGRSPYTGFWGGLNDDDRQHVGEAIRQVGIEALADRLVATLSDGERQKAMIAKALAQQTPIILLDEPTAFLDYPSKVDMLLLLSRIAREQAKTIFLSTHDLELALQTADRLWLMTHQGIVIGTPRQLANDGTLQQFLARSDVRLDPKSLTIQLTTKQN